MKENNESISSENAFVDVEKTSVELFAFSLGRRCAIESST
jgi:hypothetical protein